MLVAIPERLCRLCYPKKENDDAPGVQDACSRIISSWRKKSCCKEVALPLLQPLLQNMQRKKGHSSATKDIPEDVIKTDGYNHYPVVMWRGKWKNLNCKASPVYYYNKCRVHLWITKLLPCFAQKSRMINHWHGTSKTTTLIQYTFPFMCLHMSNSLGVTTFSHCKIHKYCFQFCRFYIFLPTFRFSIYSNALVCISSLVK